MFASSLNLRHRFSDVQEVASCLILCGTENITEIVRKTLPNTVSVIYLQIRFFRLNACKFKIFVGVPTISPFLSVKYFQIHLFCVKYMQIRSLCLGFVFFSLGEGANTGFKAFPPQSSVSYDFRIHI